MEESLEKLQNWTRHQIAETERTPDQAKYEAFLAEVVALREKARELDYDTRVLWPDFVRLVTIAMEYGLADCEDDQRAHHRISRRRDSREAQKPGS